MTELLIDNEAIQFIKAELGKENAKAARLYISGGGCCPQVHIAAVEKPLTRDVTYEEDGVIFHVEKYLDDNTGSLEITFDKTRGLLKANINYRTD